MSQQNEQNNSPALATAPVKRKRGRPRKEDVAGSDPGARTQRRRRNLTDTPPLEMLGQPVSGVIEGSFEAGFFISVSVGNREPLLRGVIFDPLLVVPVTPANDVAPQIKMTRRHEFLSSPASVPSEPRREAATAAPVLVANEVVLNDGRRTASQEFTPMATRVSDCKTVVPTGDIKLEPAIQKLLGNETVEVKPVIPIATPAAYQTGAEPNMDSKIQKSPSAKTAFESKLAAASLNGSGNGSIYEEKPVTVGELSRQKSAVYELKPDPIGTVPELKVELSEPNNASAVSEPDSKGIVAQSDAVSEPDSKGLVAQIDVVSEPDSKGLVAQSDAVQSRSEAKTDDGNDH